MSTSKDLTQKHLDHKDSSSIENVEDIENVFQKPLVARIVNPLSGIPKPNLIADVDRFIEEKGLQEYREDFIKGALVAQGDHSIDNIEELNEKDKEILYYEKAHRWSHPLTMYMTIIICSIGAATQGWDQTGSNGANLSFPTEFGIADDQWLIGVVNAAPYIGSAGLGCWLSDPLNNFFGRRGCIFITALCLIATPIASGFTHSWQTLFVVRLVLGFGMGAKGSTVPIFAAENAPAQIRGALVMGWQLWTAFGIFLGFCANCVVMNTGRISWRLQLGSAFIPALPLACLIFFCPESPRWLMRKNRYGAAFKSLLRLRHTPLQAARDMYYIHTLIEIENALVGEKSNFFKRFFELFTVPRLRRATVASGVIMIAQQMCGINIMSFYSSSIFSESGYSDKQALYASIGFGAVNFVFAFPAIWTIDTFGRRALVLFTFPQMAWTLLAAGLCFLIPESRGNSRLGAIAFFVYLFTAFYSPGEGPVPFTYSAEVFPITHREVGMAWAVTTCLGWAAVLTITFPRMKQVMTPTGAFGFYAGLNVTAFLMILFLVPETKQRTLEELDQIFSVPTGVFAKYQVQKAIPYFIRRWVFCDRRATLEPLYDIDIQEKEVADEEKRVADEKKQQQIEA